MAGNNDFAVPISERAGNFDGEEAAAEIAAAGWLAPDMDDEIPF